MYHELYRILSERFGAVLDLQSPFSAEITDSHSQ
jgi:hypothetical protein